MYHVVLLTGQSGRTVLLTGSAREALKVVAGCKLVTGKGLLVETDDGTELSDDDLHLRAAKEFNFLPIG
jgi:hypothetical protein